MVDLYYFSLFAYVFALVFAVLAIIFYDSNRAYNQRKQLITLLNEALRFAEREEGKGAAPGINAAAVAKAALDAAAKYADKPEQKVVADEVAKAADDAAGKTSSPFDTIVTTLEKLIPSPEGMEGEGRLAMTLGFVVIIGIAVIHLLLTSAQLTNTIMSTLTTPLTNMNNATLTYAQTTSAAQIDLLKSIVTILTGAVTAMVGFYFGAKTASTSGASPPQSNGSGGATPQKKVGKA